MRCALSLIHDHCNIAVITDDGDFAFKQRFLLEKTYSAFLKELVQILRKADPEEAIKTVGVSLPGYMQTRNAALNCPSIPLIHTQRFKADLQASLNREVFIANHGHMLASAAFRMPEYQTANQIFSLYLDEDICSGLLVNGALVTGANGLAGNWNHICLPWPVEFELEGRECDCGRSGCLNQFVSRSSLSNEYRYLSKNEVSAEQVFARAEQGDIVAESAVQVFEDRLARGLAMVINLIDPDVILLSGRMALGERLYTNIPRKWPGYVSGGAGQTKLAKMGKTSEEWVDASLIGAGFCRLL